MKTSKTPISENGEAVSLFSQEDSHAKDSQLQDLDLESRMTVSSGLKCSELLPKSNPLTSLARTLMASSRLYSQDVSLSWQLNPLFSERITSRKREGCSSSSESVTILSEKDIQSSRLSFRLVPSVRLTKGSAFGSSPRELLPTPNFYDYNTTWSEEAKETCLERRAQEGKTCYPQKFNCLRQLARDRVLPEPKRDWDGSLPTDVESSVDYLLHKCPPNDGGASQKLSPLFTAEMMGFDPLWTLLPFLSTDGA